jgi:ribose transport system ATP-binding protein
MDVATLKSTIAWDEILRVEHLSKTFPGQRALDDVSVSIRAGEVHAILGHNGSGKSTLIKVLAGYFEPDPGGRVLVGETELPLGAPQESLRLGLRFVHQTLGLVGRFNAVENIGLGGYTHRPDRSIDWKRQERKAKYLLGRLGVEFDIWRPLDECQAVERTAVAIARALDDHGGTIRVLVLDEPTAALPPTEVDRLFAVVREVTGLGIGVGYVSHRLDEVKELADRVTVLRDGRSAGTHDIARLDRDDLVQLIVGPATVGEGTSSPGSAAVRTAGQRTVVEVENLRGDVLDGISFAVAGGEIVGIAGLIGSGRDELAATITGNQSGARADRVRVGDHAVSGALDAARLRRAGLVIAVGNRGRGAAVAAFNVRENIGLPVLRRLRRWGQLNRRLESATADGWVRNLDIKPTDPERLFRLLSGGNQQKAVIAAALNQNPVAVALDEPTAGVDVAARQAIYDVLRTYAAQGVAFVLASSDLEDFTSVTDRVLVLSEGRIVAELRTREIGKDELLATILGFQSGSVGSEGTRAQ